MLGGILIGVGSLLALVVLVIAYGVVHGARLEAMKARDAANREHELELADREVEMWKALLAAEGDGPPGIFRQRRVLPDLVGRSQVISPKPRGQIDLNESEFGQGGRRAASGTRLEAIPEPSLKPSSDARTHPVPIERCSRSLAHPGHSWFQRPQMTTRWCDGVNADGTSPYTGVETAESG